MILLLLQRMLASLPQTTVVPTTEIGTETETDSPTVTETGTVNVNVTTRPETPETGTGTEISGTDAPSFLAALTDEAMLHDHLLSFAITSLRMVPITCPLSAAMNPTTGVVVPVTRRSTTDSNHLLSTTEGPHLTTVVHHHLLLLLMTPV